MVIGVLFVKAVLVNNLPAARGDKMESIFKSLFEIFPEHDPELGCRETAIPLRPGLPLILGLAVTQYTESLDNPLNTKLSELVNPSDNNSPSLNIMAS